MHLCHLDIQPFGQALGKHGVLVLSSRRSTDVSVWTLTVSRELHPWRAVRKRARLTLQYIEKIRRYETFTPNFWALCVASGLDEPHILGFWDDMAYRDDEPYYFGIPRKPVYYVFLDGDPRPQRRVK